MLTMFQDSLTNSKTHGKAHTIISKFSATPILHVYIYTSEILLCEVLWHYVNNTIYNKWYVNKWFELKKLTVSPDSNEQNHTLTTNSKNGCIMTKNG